MSSVGVYILQTTSLKCKLQAPGWPGHCRSTPASEQGTDAMLGGGEPVTCPLCGREYRPDAEAKAEGFGECECGTIFERKPDGSWRAVDDAAEAQQGSQDR